MYRSIVTALAALAMSATAAHADWAYTRWGMTPEQVAKASGGAVRALPAAERKTFAQAGMQTGAEGTYTEGALKLRLAFGFDAKSGGLECAIYTVMDAAQNEDLKASMIKAYGPPQETSGLPAIGLSTLSWTKPDDISFNLSTGERAFVLHCANPPQ